MNNSGFNSDSVYIYHYQQKHQNKEQDQQKGEKEEDEQQLFFNKRNSTASTTLDLKWEKLNRLKTAKSAIKSAKSIYIKKQNSESTIIKQQQQQQQQQLNTTSQRPLTIQNRNNLNRYSAPSLSQSQSPFSSSSQRMARIIDSSRYTITFVLQRGYFNLVRYLLLTGLDPNQTSPSSTSNSTSTSTTSPYSTSLTPLIYCTFIRDQVWAISVAQNLLQSGAKLKFSDNKGLTPLHYCSAFGKVSLNFSKLFKTFINFLKLFC
jgi:hypothetical protein